MHMAKFYGGPADGKTDLVPFCGCDHGDGAHGAPAVVITDETDPTATVHHLYEWDEDQQHYEYTRTMTPAALLDWETSGAVRNIIPNGDDR
jgi:hypothetical protein